MGDQDHSLINEAVHILEHPRILVRVQAEIVAADARVLRARVLAVTFAPEDFVLNARDVLDIYARPDEILRGSLRFAEDRERALLLGARLTQDKGAADLRVIAVDLGRELGGDVVTRLKAPLGRRSH